MPRSSDPSLALAGGLTASPDALRARLSAVGVWSIAFAMVGADAARAGARHIEELGYSSLWIGEGPHSKEALVNASLLLSATDRLVVATGIANIYVRDANAAAAAALTLGEAHPGRFVLGLGVSHRVNVEPRGHAYERPLGAMGDYLDRLAAASFEAEAPSQAVPVVLAALRPKMLALAARRSAGAHTYLVPVAHTARARDVLGPGPLLATELGFLLDDEPERARARAREHMAWYLGQPNYVANLRDLGYGDTDLAGGGSDGLVDALVAWGGPHDVLATVAEHRGAGADQVLLQPLAAGFAAGLDDLATLATSGPGLSNFT